MLRTVIFAILSPGCLLLTSDLSGAEPPVQVQPVSKRPREVGLYLDRSGSMSAGNKERSMKESAKLVAALLDGRQELVIIDFESNARASRFGLRLANDRQAAKKHIDDLSVEGGTNYLAALKSAGLPKDAPAIFISDGEPDGEPEQVLAYLKANHSGPLFTVAVEASAGAQKLLQQMAAQTGGAFVNVEKSEDLVKVLLGLASQLGDYRAYTPKDDCIEFAAVSGKVIALGYDAVPQVNAKPAVSAATFSHHARLPGEQVDVVVLDLPAVSAVTVRIDHKRTVSGRLATILRSDLTRARMTVDSAGTAATDGRLKVETRFFDQDGQPVDPRKRKDLSSEFRVLDEAGRVLTTATGKPSANSPVLHAELPLPKVPGLVTIRNVTGEKPQDTPFEAVEDRTILVEEPLSLEVSPSSLTLKSREGRFTTAIRVKVTGAEKLSPTFTARLDGMPADLRLLSCQAKDDTLTLELEGLRPGMCRGKIIIAGSASRPIKPAEIPYEVTVTERFQGLSLAPSREVDLGSVFANSGMKEFATFTLPSEDIDPATIKVDVPDLSGSTVAIPLRADKTSIEPSKGKPATLTLSGTIQNVPAGEYTSTVVMALDNERTWKTKVRLTVTEPLSARPVSFGKVEAGRVVKGTLVVKNASGAIQDLTIRKPTFSAQGGDVIATVPDRVASIGAGQEKEIPISLAISPLVRSRGPHKAVITVRRVSGQDISVPIEVTIVDEGRAAAAFLVAPEKILITGKPGEVIEFELRIKPAQDHLTVPKDLAIVAGSFQSGRGKPVSIVIDFKTTSESRPSGGSAMTAKGYLVIPDATGTYAGELTVRASGSGVAVVLVTVEVK